LYDERKPLEPAYFSVPISKAGSVYTDGDLDDLERLKHAPPGYVIIVVMTRIF
jgi:hypothetical protein